jgi:hypothetical protein
MLDMKCPSCGAAGRVPREKVNTRLVCKKCLRVFHITPSGGTVLGEPAAPKHEELKHRPARDAAQYEAVERFDEMTARLSKIKLPKVQPMTLGIVGGIVLLSALGYWVFSRQSIESRSLDLAKAIIKSDMKPVIDLSAPGTEMDTIRWYNDVYRQYGDLKMALGGQEAGVIVEPVGEAKGGEAQVKVHFSKSGTRFDGSIYSDALNPNPSLASGKDSLEVPLFWVKDTWGNWLLDGTKTYSGGVPSR